MDQIEAAIRDQIIEGVIKANALGIGIKCNVPHSFSYTPVGEVEERKISILLTENERSRLLKTEN